jgi:hypothetical protein
MMGMPPGARIWLACGATDLRKCPPERQIANFKQKYATTLDGLQTLITRDDVERYPAQKNNGHCPRAQLARRRFQRVTITRIAVISMQRF